MRKHFHLQLERYWQLHPSLKRQYARPMMGRSHLPDLIGKQYEQFGYKWVPLVRKETRIDCSLNILMLRIDPPGSVVVSGDLDRRITNVIDALRKPRQLNEMGEEGCGSSDQFFYCLVEDDSLITQLSIDVDTLLEPVWMPMSKQQVRLVLTIGLTASIDDSVRLHPEEYAPLEE
jgi:hypothetical protein